MLVQADAELWSQLDSYLSATAFYLMPDRAKGSLTDHERIVALLSESKTDLWELEVLARKHKLKTAQYLTEATSEETRGVPLTPAGRAK